MRSRYIFLLRIFLFVSDLVIVNGAYLAGLQVIRYFHQEINPQQYTSHLMIINLIWLSATGVFGLYAGNSIRLIENLFRATWRSIVLQAVLVVVFFYAIGDTGFTKQFLVALFAIETVAFLISRFVGTIIDLTYRRRFRKRLSVGVLGFNPTGIKLAEYFTNHPLDYRFDGIIDEGESLYLDEYGDLHNHVKQGIHAAAEKSIRELYVSLPPHVLPQTRSLLEEAEAKCIRLRIVPDLSGAMASRFRVNYLADFPVLSIRPEPLEDIKARVKKRTFDIGFSLLVIVLLLSWLYPILALLIKMQSRGPVLFKQQRSGRDNKTFWCYKFRSMRVNAESDKRQATRNDNRITPIGRFLRKTSLDELPQFFNVLKGEMSVVGPRPHMLAHTEQYRAIINTFMVRHFLKPGITGWAQVQGFRGETKDPAQMEARVEHDIWYMEHWSLMLDIRICFLTVYQVFKGDSKAF